MLPPHSQPLTAYLAPEGSQNDLLEELKGDVVEVYERLILTAGTPKPAMWAQNIWRNPQFIEVDSIGDAAKKLKALQRNWASYAFHMHRRAKLIEEKLPHVSAKPIEFPNPAPSAPLGSWTLIDTNMILASPDCSNPFPNGEVQFIENRTDPPNRAYLKLWEAFTLLRAYPKPGDKCVDLGASPGGWSWVLSELGCKTIAVDKSPLDAKLMTRKNISFQEGSAFALEPKDVGAIDWLFSDVACYPERLLKLVENWRASGLVKNMVCTLKFQGKTDHTIAAEFAKIEGSRILHLCHNKHELTFALLEGNKT